MNVVGIRYAAMGDNDNAMLWLDKAAEAGDGSPWMRWHIQHNPDYDNLRDDPRFQALLNKINK